MNNKLSIILPVYNGESYIRDCIESILRQTYNNWELIIINDGSSDGTKNIIEEYESKIENITVITQNNLGGQIARNRGMDIASGDYISFVDADDYVLPELYTLLIKNLNEYDADMSFCGFFREGKPNRESNIFVIDNNIEIVNSIVGENTKCACGGYLWNKVYKKQCLQDFRFNEKINLGEDGLFNLIIASRLCRIVGTTEELYFYRKNNNGITKTHQRPLNLWMKEIEEYEKIKQLYVNGPVADYINNRLIDCCLRAGESIVINNRPMRELKHIKYKIITQTDLQKCKNKKTKILATLLCRFIELYWLAIYVKSRRIVK